MAKPSSEAPEFPPNLTIGGALMLPLWNDADITKLQQWRLKKGKKAGKFPDRIGGVLALKKPQEEKVIKYLLETFLPYTDKLYAATGKGFDADVSKEIRAKIEAKQWGVGDYTLPLRALTEKDIENLPDETYTVKFSFKGSGGNEIQKRAIFAESSGEGLRKGDLDDLTDAGISHGNPDNLWWGLKNTFTGRFNFNPFSAAQTGIMAYTRSLELRADLPMTWLSDSETVVSDEEEDWE